MVDGKYLATGCFKGNEFIQRHGYLGSCQNTGSQWIMKVFAKMAMASN